MTAVAFSVHASLAPTSVAEFVERRFDGLLEIAFGDHSTISPQPPPRADGFFDRLAKSIDTGLQKHFGDQSNIQTFAAYQDDWQTALERRIDAWRERMLGDHSDVSGRVERHIGDVGEIRIGAPPSRQSRFIIGQRGTQYLMNYATLRTQRQVDRANDLRQQVYGDALTVDDNPFDSTILSGERIEVTKTWTNAQGGMQWTSEVYVVGRSGMTDVGADSLFNPQSPGAQLDDKGATTGRKHGHALLS